MTGHGGWPLNAFLTPDQAAVLRRDLLPARVAPWAAEWRMVLDAIADAWHNRRDRSRDQGATFVETLGATARLQPSPEPIDEQGLTDALSHAARRPTTAQRRLGRRAEVPARLDDRASCWRRASTRWRCARLRSMARAGSTTSRRRRLRALLGRRDVDRPALREDALRQRAAGARVPARLAGERRRAAAARRCETLDWALRELRAPEGGFCVVARRRLRGRRGQVLRVDGGRAARRARRDVDERSRFGVLPPGQLRGRHVLEARGPEPDAPRSGDPLQAAEALARRGCGPGWTTRADLVERADDRRARRRRRGARPRRLPRRPRAAPRRVPARRAPRTATGACCAPGRTGGALRATWRTTPICSRRWSRCTSARWIRGGLRGRGSSPTRCIERFADPERGGFFTTADDHERLVGAAQGPRGLADPVGELVGGASVCCACTR